MHRMGKGHRPGDRRESLMTAGTGICDPGVGPQGRPIANSMIDREAVQTAGAEARPTINCRLPGVITRGP